MFSKLKLAGLVVALCAQASLAPGAQTAELAAATSGDRGTTQLDSSFVAWETPDTKPRAMLLSIHGFGLHKGAFDPFARRMVQLGVAVYALDVRGFGSWTEDGVKHRKVDFYNTLIDVGTHISWLQRIHPGVPIFLLGESMGGAVALQATAMFPDSVKGLIASVPGNEYFGASQTSLDVARRFVRRPHKPIDLSPEVVDRATDKGELKKSWKNDPAARLQLEPLEILEFHQFMKRSHQMAKRIDRTPVLMLHGVQDKLSKPDGTIKLFKELQTKDKNLVMFGHSEHLILEDAQFDQHIIEVVSSWLDKHCRP